MALSKLLMTIGWQATFHRSALYGVAGKLFFLGLWLGSCQQAPSNIHEAETPGPVTSSPNAKAPPPPPPNSYLAQLPPEATGQLVDMGINIVIPTYLTQNMALANYGVGGLDGNGAYYWLVYRDDNSRCFAIEYLSGGIEDIWLEKQESLRSDLFGEGYSLYHGKFPNGSDGELPESDLFTDWFAGEDGFYRLVGAGLVNSQDYGQGDCSNLTVKEAISIAESLSYLPTDIRTLDL
nr:hypothetical protein [Leptolyngbyaceae cyanobacterium MAG.088]